VDDCVNCRFFIGPVDGPFFIRTSKNCTVTVACRQLRTRLVPTDQTRAYQKGDNSFERMIGDNETV
jgi:hypothetical protein